jgi:hypothetical protein
MRATRRTTKRRVLVGNLGDENIGWVKPVIRSKDDNERETLKVEELTPLHLSCLPRSSSRFDHSSAVPHSPQPCDFDVPVCQREKSMFDDESRTDAPVTSGNAAKS